MLNIILLGAPGSGKGTQAKLLSEYYGLNHLSTGEVLRQEIEKKTKLGLQIENITNKGELVSDDIVNNLVENYIINVQNNCQGIIFDGYPRSVIQAKNLISVLHKNQMQVFLFDMFVNTNELIKRLTLRGQTSGRDDDEEEIIKQRIDIYNKTTIHVGKYFAENGNYFSVNGNFSVEQTFNQIKKIIDLIQKQ